MTRRAFASLAATAAFVLGHAAPALAGSFEQAPPRFSFAQGVAVPVDMEAVHVDYVFDAAARTTTANATVRFRTAEDGFPMFDLIPAVSAMSLDGESLDPALLATTRDPDGVTTLRVLKRAVDADAEHELTLRFALSSSQVTYQSGSVAAGFFMDDLSGTGRGFFEQYGPANFEYDQVKFTFTVKVVGATAEHEVFTNGALTATGANEWSIDFPDYFTTSSLYFHLVRKGRFPRQDFTYAGVEKSFPVTIYADTAASAASAAAKTRSVLAELERDYGPFAHARLVAYVTPDGGGMEHCGATMTSLWALDHELTHSWFARGVMPANGNAGWIDEAMASWRDDGYLRASGEPSRAAVNLGGFSPYRRQTTQAAYSQGESLMREFDFMGRAAGGLKPIMRDLFLENQRTTITVGFFKSFMESKLGRDLSAIFNRYVYGRAGAADAFKAVGPTVWEKPTTRHPRPYTAEELARYR